MHITDNKFTYPPDPPPLLRSSWRENGKRQKQLLTREVYTVHAVKRISPLFKDPYFYAGPRAFISEPPFAWFLNCCRRPRRPEWRPEWPAGPPSCRSNLEISVLQLLSDYKGKLTEKFRYTRFFDQFSSNSLYSTCTSFNFCNTFLSKNFTNLFAIFVICDLIIQRKKDHGKPSNPVKLYSGQNSMTETRC